MSSFFKITKQAKNSQARLGEITTSHGVIHTPVFMPVGTQATVKAIKPEELKTLGAEIILGNTYHLYLRPGHEVIKKLGGLHKFMNWEGPILTDSGGFQVFSLGREPEKRQIPVTSHQWPATGDRNPATGDLLETIQRNTKLARITDDGVEFQSHIDGSKHLMTPEKSIEIQMALGSDILMVFDECTAYPATEEQAKKSMERSLAWEKRSLEFFRSPIPDPQSPIPRLFAIIQGGMYPELRKECVERLIEICEPRSTNHDPRFAGYALGGLSVGEPMPQMYELAEYTTSLIPPEYPRYLMGVGMPEDIIRCVDFGLDMFDCVVPTRNARNGMLFTSSGFIQIKQAQYAEDPNPIDLECSCYTCSHYSRAYLRHLHMAKEILSSILSTIHNLHYYLNLLREVRLAIQEDRFVEFKKDFFSKIK